MWQAYHAKLADAGFTVVGIALDAEGVAPAKLYYDKYAVTFPALVDPNYATGFEVVPHTFFVDELGVVQATKGWQERIRPADKLRPVTDAIRSQWSKPDDRLAPAAIARLAAKHRADTKDLAAAVELASRYLDLNLTDEARDVLKTSVAQFEPLQVATNGSPEQTRLLSQAYFQLARASERTREQRVRYATLSFYLKPAIGFGKQIARIVAPEKFDGTPDGRFDNAFREGTLRRLKMERAEWLKGDRPSP